MSTRAYKIIVIKTEKTPTFNCSYDNWVVNLAYGQDGYNGESGILEFERSQIEDALTEKEHKNKEHKNILKDILKDMDSLKEDFVQYYCF